MMAQVTVPSGARPATPVPVAITAGSGLQTASSGLPEVNGDYRNHLKPGLLAAVSALQ